MKLAAFLQAAIPFLGSQALVQIAEATRLRPSSAAAKKTTARDFRSLDAEDKVLNAEDWPTLSPAAAKGMDPAKVYKVKWDRGPGAGVFAFATYGARLDKFHIPEYHPVNNFRRPASRVWCSSVMTLWPMHHHMIFISLDRIG